MKQKRLSTSGTVLILVLWALSFLTVFAVNVGVIVRQKISLTARLERRAEAKQLARQGVEQALAVLHANDDKPVGPEIFALQKRLRHNNPESFCRIPLGRGELAVTYRNYDEQEKKFGNFCGLIDEQSKINLNNADRAILMELAVQVLKMEKEEAGKLAGAIIDWREFGESEIAGFQSDEYYDNLESPYPEKKTPYEVMEELALVQGVTPRVYDVLKNFVTVYGPGRVNINTAPRPVLLALGLRPELVEQIVVVRNGPDQIAATGDDIFFQGVGDVALILSQFTRLTPEDTAKISELEGRGLLGVQSDIYRVHSQGHLMNTAEEAIVECVVTPDGDKILSWREWLQS